MAVGADRCKLLDKQYEDTDLPELFTAPVAALAGVTGKDGELLQQEPNLKTIGK